MIAPAPLDLRLHLVTAGRGREVVDRAAAAAAAGAGVVQVRAKDADARELAQLVVEVAAAVARCAPGTRVLLDDRVDVAWAVRREGHPVHGVHLGQGDLPADAARALLGPDAVIGLTVGTVALLERCQDVLGSVDYLGAGPLRATPSKRDAPPPLGLAGYPELVAASPVPVVAIGDVRAGDVPALRAVGVAGVAVVREIMAAEDATAATRALLAPFDLV